MSAPDIIQARAMRGQSLREIATVIDAHAHMHRVMDIHINAADPADLLASMDRIGIEAACISSLIALNASCRQGNDLVAQAVRMYPGRFYGYVVINPNYPEEIEPELERCLNGGGHWAVKIHPTWHKYPSDGPAYHTVYAYLQKKKGLVLSHIFETPAVLDKLSRDYPDVVFIMAHTGGYDGRLPYPYASLIRERDNIYADLTLSSVPYNGMEKLAEVCGADKLLFASDAPFNDNAHQVGRVTHARISEEDKRKIIGGNMHSLLKRFGALA